MDPVRPVAQDYVPDGSLTFSRQAATTRQLPNRPAIKQITRLHDTNRSSILKRLFCVFIAFILVVTFGSPVCAQVQLPSDVGTTVNGFQDDFDGAALNPNWIVAGQNVFSVGGGVLHVASATGDPNHLLCEIP